MHSLVLLFHLPPESLHFCFAILLVSSTHLPFCIVWVSLAQTHLPRMFNFAPEIFSHCSLRFKSTQTPFCSFLLPVQLHLPLFGVPPDVLHNSSAVLSIQTPLLDFLSSSQMHWLFFQSPSEFSHFSSLVKSRHLPSSPRIFPSCVQALSNASLAFLVSIARSIAPDVNAPTAVPTPEPNIADDAAVCARVNLYAFSLNVVMSIPNQSGVQSKTEPA